MHAVAAAREPRDVGSNHAGRAKKMPLKRGIFYMRFHRIFCRPSDPRHANATDDAPSPVSRDSGVSRH